jgi:ABC-type Fe2+-enterobactin transport system substrate-binding protein
MAMLINNSMAENIPNTESIIVRRGQAIDLPTLDEAELAFAIDENRLFVGSDIDRDHYPYSNNEILTELSTVAFSAIHAKRMRESGDIDFHRAFLYPTSEVSPRGVISTTITVHSP